MIFTAKNLLTRLEHLTLSECDGKIEWIGTDKKWNEVIQEDDGVDFNNEDMTGSNYEDR